jgi:hypothetical protein
MEAQQRAHKHVSRSCLRPGFEDFFRLAPNLDIETTSNPRIFDLHTDSRGMRSPEPAVPKPSGTYRVLAVGDSCTFGSGVGQSGTYPMQLEHHLLSMRNEPRFEVLNAGVPGFTSFQSLGLFEMEGAALSPDAVIFGSNQATLWKRTEDVGPGVR